jgi:hypothetical protein
MDYQKLLFAAQVRILARDIWNANSSKYWQSLKDLDDPDRNAKRDQWESEHKIAEFVPDALRRIQEVADLIP